MKALTRGGSPYYNWPVPIIIATTPVTSTNITTTTRFSETYVYGVGIVAVLAIDVCVFFGYKTYQAENKKLVNKRQDQPPKRRHML